MSFDDDCIDHSANDVLCDANKYVHVKCLQQWRTKSASQKAFYCCDQCGYRYHFARTRVVGIATNPGKLGMNITSCEFHVQYRAFAVVVGILSSIFFTILVICSSFVTTSFLADDAQWGYTYSIYLHPLEVMRNLIKATIGIFVNDDLLDSTVLGSSFTGPIRSSADAVPPGILKTLVRRFLLGLPVVGAGSIAQMLISFPFPLQMFRMRTTRRWRNSGDAIAIIVLTIVLAGAIRSVHLYERYGATVSCNVV